MGQKPSAQSEKMHKKNPPKYFSAEPVRYARCAQSRGQHLFCSLAVIIRLLPLLPSLLRLLEVYIYKKNSVVKFSVIMFVFMCQGESKIPLHDKNFITTPKSVAA